MFRILLLFVLSTSFTLLAEDIAGRWGGMMGTQPVHMTLKQQGQEVSGTFGYDDGSKPVPITKVGMRGEHLMFEVQGRGKRFVSVRLDINRDGMSGEAISENQTTKIVFPRAEFSPAALNRNSGVVSAPVLIHKADPEYSEEARRAKLQGTVVLYLVIDEKGKVTNPKIQRSLGLGLDEKALECVAKWRFKPGMKSDGTPVSTSATIEVNFRM
jgi:TonB family protein